MKRTEDYNIQKLTRIIKEINIIKNSKTLYNIDNAQALRKSEFAQRIWTQCITTIEAIKRLLDDDIKSHIPLFSGINLKRTRDISSHDYDSVDMNIVYVIATRLTERNITVELKNEINRCKRIGVSSGD